MSKPDFSLGKGETTDSAFPDQPVTLQLSDEAIRACALYCAVQTLPQQMATVDPLELVQRFEDYIRGPEVSDGEETEAE